MACIINFNTIKSISYHHFTLWSTIYLFQWIFLKEFLDSFPETQHFHFGHCKLRLLTTTPFPDVSVRRDEIITFWVKYGANLQLGKSLVIGKFTLIETHTRILPHQI